MIFRIIGCYNGDIASGFIGCPIPAFRNEYEVIPHSRGSRFPCGSSFDRRIVRRRFMGRTRLDDSLYGIFSVRPDKPRACCNPQRLCSRTCDQHYLRPSHRVRGIFIIPRLALVGNPPVRHPRPFPRCSWSFHRSAYRTRLISKFTKKQPGAFFR